MSGGGWVRPDGCLCGVEEPYEFCPDHGRSYTALAAEVARLRAEKAQQGWASVQALRADRDTWRASCAVAESERDRLRADLVAAAIERVSLRAEVEEARNWLAMKEAELRGVQAIRDRLAAVLAETPENIEAMVDAYVAGGMARVLAAARARAGQP